MQRSFPLYGAEIRIDSSMTGYVDTIHRFRQIRNAASDLLHNLISGNTAGEDVTAAMYSEIRRTVDELLSELEGYGLRRSASDYLSEDCYSRALADPLPESGAESAEKPYTGSTAGPMYETVWRSLEEYFSCIGGEAAGAENQDAAAAAEEAAGSTGSGFPARVEQVTGRLLDSIQARYLSDLSECGALSLSWLSEISIGRSSELLKSLSEAKRKKQILREALVLCPYNPRVYVSANDAGLLNGELTSLGYALHIGGDILSLFDRQISDRKASGSPAAEPMEAIRRYEAPCRGISAFSGKSAASVMLRYFPGLKDEILYPFRTFMDLVSGYGRNSSGLFAGYIREKKKGWEELLSAEELYRSTQSSELFVRSLIYSPEELDQYLDFFGEDLLKDISSIVGCRGSTDYDEIVYTMCLCIEPYLDSIAGEIEGERTRLYGGREAGPEQKEAEAPKSAAVITGLRKAGYALAILCIILTFVLACLSLFDLAMLACILAVAGAVLAFVCMILSRILHISDRD